MGAVKKYPRNVGREDSMKVKTVLKEREIYRIAPDARLCEAINELNRRRIGALIVSDEGGGVLGIVSERDILRIAYDTRGQMCDMAVGELMTPRERLVTATPDDDLRQVMQKMTERRVRHIPIMEGDALRGLLSIGDVVKALLDAAVEENAELQDYITGARYPR
jgi:CBS domain-containing protein